MLSAKRPTPILYKNVHSPIELRESAHTRRPTRLHVSPFWPKLKKKPSSGQTFNTLKINYLLRLITLITSPLLVYLDFPLNSSVLIGEIARRPFARPTAVALVPVTFPGPSMPGPVQFGHPAFRRIACLPILPAAAVPAVVCHSAGPIDFAPADFA